MKTKVCIKQYIAKKQVNVYKKIYKETYPDIKIFEKNINTSMQTFILTVTQI